MSEEPPEDDRPVEGGTVEVTGFITYAGEGFGAVRTEKSVGLWETPPSASARAVMRDGLPAIYRDDDFGMRFVGALETVLDPILALLDSLPSHFDPKLAPIDVLDLITAWLGLEYDEAQPLEQLRVLVQSAAELGRRRGTRAGLELALALNFPGLPLRVEDKGSVSWASDSAPAKDAPAPSFVVYCDQPVGPERQAAIARLIEAIKPVHVGYRLRVRAPKADRQPKGS